MPTKRASVDLEPTLARRFKARLAYVGTSMTAVFAGQISQWVGTWGSNFVTHTLQPDEDLRSLSQQYYGDAELYLAIAYFNDIAYPELVQPGQQVRVPEPGAPAATAVHSTAVPAGVSKITVSVDVDDQLYRRFKARAAFEGVTVTSRLYDLVMQWTGDWPSRTMMYLVKSGDSLTTIAFRFYNDSTKHWVIAHLNGISNPASIAAGQQLIIPEPLTTGQLPIGESPYLVGIHDRGGESLMADKGRKGWVLATEAIGRNPYDYNGMSYADLESAGYGVLVRLNHAYGNPDQSSFPGTIPERDATGQSYQEFAVRCGNFVEHSSGCHIWIIANEMNHPNEWPGGPNGQMLTPMLYADCFQRCYAEIHKRAGHKNDQVVLGAIAPWPNKATYPGNERGDWVKYLGDLLALVRGACDGIALHTYTHGSDPAKITAFAPMDGPYADRNFEFRAYRQFLEAVPASMRNLPVYITETDQNDPWAHSNTGWVQAAYAEIDRWNQDPTHQKIRCLLLYRWLPHDQWSFAGIQEVKDDFRAALDHDYRWW